MFRVGEDRSRNPSGFEVRPRSARQHFGSRVLQSLVTAVGIHYPWSAPTATYCNGNFSVQIA